VSRYCVLLSAKGVICEAMSSRCEDAKMKFKSDIASHVDEVSALQGQKPLHIKLSSR
jgi:hypothetical protein